MKNRLLSFFITSMLVFSLIDPSVSYAFHSAPDVTFDEPVSEPKGDYAKGEVLVSVISDDNTALTKEGEPFDDICVEETFNFGSADTTVNTSKPVDEEVLNYLEKKDYHVSLVTSEKYSTGELISLLKKKAYVTSVEPNYIQDTSSLTNDEFVDKQWALSSQTASINISKAWSVTPQTTPVVAVIDTGINPTHEDLAANLWHNPYPKQLGGTIGFDCAENMATVTDTDGHGTHCAGTIAATQNNMRGISGIAPEAKIMALKVFDSFDTCKTSYIIFAFNYMLAAVNAGVPIVAANCSWGTSSGGQSGSILCSLVNSLGSKGVLFSFASGNSGKNVDEEAIYMPYDMNRDYTILVGASTGYNTPALYSNYGKNRVDIFAPGDMILSASHQPVFNPTCYTGDRLNELVSYADTCDTTSTFSNYTCSSALGTAPANITDSISYAPNVDCESSTSSGSIRWHITNKSSLKQTVYFYLDVTGHHFNTKGTYYCSSVIGVSGTKGLEWDHSVKISTSGNNRFITKNGRTYLYVIGLGVPANSSNDYFMDDIGISVNNPNTSLFGYYDYSSGTSMAAPMVTGAIAKLASIYPGESAQVRRSRLLSCVRKLPNFTERCVTGGILDLSKFDSYVMPTAISLSASSTTCKVNKSISLSTTLAPGGVTNPNITYSLSNKNYGTLKGNTFTASAKGGGKTVTITVTSVANPSLKSSVRIKIPAVKVTKLKAKNKKITLKVGRTKTIKVTVYPSTATNKKLKWTSGNKRYATVSSSGKVKARKAGKTVTIKATTRDGSKKTVRIRVKIVKK